MAITQKRNLSDNTIIKYVITGFNDPELGRTLAMMSLTKYAAMLKCYENTTIDEKSPEISRKEISALSASGLRRSPTLRGCRRSCHCSPKPDSLHATAEVSHTVAEVQHTPTPGIEARPRCP